MTLAWDPSSDANVTSYVLYYGAASGAYTFQKNVGNKTSATVSNLSVGVWYFTVTARDDAAGLESDPSNEVSCNIPDDSVGSVNHPPVIGCIPPPIAVDEETTLSLQLCATDPDLPRDTLTWQIGAEAPAGLTLEPNTGMLTWTPTEAQGPKTNPFTVIVRDNGRPSLSDSRVLSLVVNEVNRPPSLAAVPDQLASVLGPLIVTNVVSDPDSPPNQLRFSLAPGAPSGARINRSTGVFRWAPSLKQAPSTNLITVRVTDDGSPALSDSTTFTVVVADYLEVAMGTTEVLAGQFGRVPITIEVTAPITNLNITFDAPVPDLTEFTLAASVLPLVTATLRPAGPAQFQVNIRAMSGQTLLGTQTVSSLQFRAEAKGRSAFVPLKVTGVSAYQLNGLPLLRTLAQDGRVAIIGTEPLLEATIQDGQPQLVIYAPPGPSYTVQRATDLTAPQAWVPIWNGSISNLVQLLTPPAAGSFNLFRVTAP